MFGLMAVATTSGIAAVVFNLELPPEESLLQTSFVCAADVTEACGPDNAIASFSAEEDRTNVQLDEVPDVLKQAVLATEDQDYYEHGGVDPVGITPRALQRHPRHGRDPGRIHHHPAVRQERVPDLRAQHRPQGEGGGAGGEARARAQQGRDPRALPQHHLLRAGRLRRRRRVAGLLRQGRGGRRAPRGLLPRGPDPLAGRRRRPRAPRGGDAAGATRCSPRWRAEGYIDDDERDFIDATPIETGVVPVRDRRGLGRVEGNTADDNIGTKYFVEAVRRQIAEQYGEDVLYGGGLRIYTTLDFDMQRAAWEAVTSTLDQPTDPDAALVAVDQYGYVKAMVGGRDFEDDEVNLALGAAAGGSGRGAGSSFKPFVLAEAIRQDISLNSKFNAPASITFEDVQGAKPGEPWKVSNYGDTEQGVLDLVDATRVSSNTAYAQLMLEVGAGQRRLPGQPPRRVGGAARRRVAGARERRRLAARHGGGLQHLRQPWRAQRPDPRRQGRAGGRGRRPRGDRPGRAHRGAGAVGAGGRSRHLLPPGGGEGRHRRVGVVRQARGGQDRDHPGQQGRLVRRLRCSLCLLPFPNDYFTVADPTTPTGRRVNFTPELMPRNNNGTPIDPTDWNASDGFSPGSQIMTFVPGIDLGVTGAAPITDIGRSLDPDAPIVLLDADTGERHPYWAELDTWTINQADRALVVRSARNLVEGHRYVVALRNLMDANGNEIGASDAFKQFRDHNDSHDPAVKERKKSMHAVFRDLARAPASTARTCTLRGTSRSRAPRASPVAC